MHLPFICCFKLFALVSVACSHRLCLLIQLLCKVFWGKGISAKSLPAAFLHLLLQNVCTCSSCSIYSAMSFGLLRKTLSSLTLQQSLLPKPCLQLPFICCSINCLHSLQLLCKRPMSDFFHLTTQTARNCSSCCSALICQPKLPFWGGTPTVSSAKSLHAASLHLLLQTVCTCSGCSPTQAALVAPVALQNILVFAVGIAKALCCLLALPLLLLALLAIAVVIASACCHCHLILLLLLLLLLL